MFSRRSLLASSIAGLVLSFLGFEEESKCFTNSIGSKFWYIGELDPENHESYFHSKDGKWLSMQGVDGTKEWVQIW